MCRVLSIASITAAALLAVAAIRFTQSTHLFSVDERPFALTSAPGQEEIMIDERFDVNPGDQLRVDIGHSDVFVETGTATEARVRISLKGDRMDRARAFFEHLNFRVDQSGREISVVTDPRGSWNGRSGGAEIDVRITLPRRFDVDLSVAHGDVDVESLEGNLAFKIAHGDISSGSLAGPKLVIRAEHGDLEANHLAGRMIEFDVRHGDLAINEVKAEDLSIDVAHGDVDVRHMEGHPRISVEHGDISVHLASNAGGTFRNRHGNISLSAPRGAAADLVFAANEIELGDEYTFDGSRDRRRLEGRINGGGETIDAQASHGHISLEAD